MIGALHSFIAETMPPAEGSVGLTLAGSIHAVAVALCDLQNGREHEMFKPAKREQGGRPPILSAEADLRGAAAKALDLLVEGGTGLEPAAEQVADALNENRGEHPRVTADQVKKWREGCRAGDKGLKHDPALERFKTPLPPAAGTCAAAQGAWLLQRLRWMDRRNPA